MDLPNGNLRNFQYNGGSGVSGRAARRKQIPAAQHDDFLNALDDEPCDRRRDRMPEYHGTSVIIEAIHINVQLLRHIKVIGRKRIVCFDSLNVMDSDIRLSSAIFTAGTTAMAI